MYQRNFSKKWYLPLVEGGGRSAEPGRSLGHLSEHRKEQQLQWWGDVHGKVHLLMILGFGQCCAYVKMKLSFLFLFNGGSSYDFPPELELITVVWWVDTSLIYEHNSNAGTNSADANAFVNKGCSSDCFLLVFHIWS